MNRKTAKSDSRALAQGTGNPQQRHPISAMFGALKNSNRTKLSIEEMNHIAAWVGPIWPAALNRMI
jgi:hypothetical protein